MPQGTIDAFGWAVSKKGTGKQPSADKLPAAATAAKARSASSDEDAALEKVGIKRTLNKGAPGGLPLPHQPHFRGALYDGRVCAVAAPLLRVRRPRPAQLNQ